MSTIPLRGDDQPHHEIQVIFPGMELPHWKQHPDEVHFETMQFCPYDGYPLCAVAGDIVCDQCHRDWW